MNLKDNDLKKALDKIDTGELFDLKDGLYGVYISKWLSNAAINGEAEVFIALVDIIKALREKNERLEKIIHAWLKWDSTEALEGKEATQKAYENFVCLMREYIGLSNEGKSPLVEPIPELTLYSQLQRQLEEARGKIERLEGELTVIDHINFLASQVPKGE